ncbi:WD40 repeat domain-containing protein [Streptomyces sp. M19]
MTCLTALTVDGRDLLAAASGRTIALWDLDEPGRPRWLTGHAAAVTALTRVVVAGEDALASAAADRTVRLWNPAALTAALRARRTRTASVTAAAYSTGDGNGPRGQPAREARPYLALGHGAEGPWLWDVRTGERTRVPGAGDHTVTAMAWAERPGGRALLWAAAEDRAIRCWDPRAPVRPASWKATTCPCAPSPRASPRAAGTSRSAGATTAGSGCGTWTASPSYGTGAATTSASARWRSPRTGTARTGSPRRARTAPSACGTSTRASQGADPVPSGVINALAVNARPTDGLPPHLVSGGDDGTVRLWDLLTGRPWTARSPGAWRRSRPSPPGPRPTWAPVSRAAGATAWSTSGTRRPGAGFSNSPPEPRPVAVGPPRRFRRRRRARHRR